MRKLSVNFGIYHRILQVTGQKEKGEILGHRLGIFLFILGGVKGIVEATHAPFTCQFETALPIIDGILPFFVLLSTQERS